MKKISTIIALFGTVALLALPRAMKAQSLTLGPVSASQFCAGDPVSVTFTATGSWGHNNAFTLQLSDPSGSFSSGNQTNIGSIIDSTDGSHSVITSIPIKTAYSANYRVRITGAYPYTESADNGSNIQIGDYPLKVLFSDYGSFPAPHPVEPLVIGLPYNFKFVGSDEAGLQDYGVLDSVYVNYGDGASPAYRAFSTTAQAHLYDNNPVVYSTSGPKQLITQSVAQGGCSISDTFWAYVYDCTTPVVPHDAVIISQNGVIGSSFTTYWVNPGFTFTPARFDTVFAESGASIIGSTGLLTEAIVYVKPGASSDMGANGVVLYAPGAGVNKSGDSLGAPTLECTSLSFDYSVAPPNSIMHINENAWVVPAASLEPIQILPNPTNGIITLQGIPANSNVTIMNPLGETVQVLNTDGNSIMNLDLSNYADGAYYVRIASQSSVTTKRVVKQ